MMETSATDEPNAALRWEVELALEDAGYTVAGMVNSTLTFDSLQATPNPVVVILNETSPQCIVVELASSSGSALSLAGGPPNVENLSTSAAAAAGQVSRHGMGTAIYDVNATQPIPVEARAAGRPGSQRRGRGGTGRRYQMRRIARGLARVSRVRVMRRSVVAQLTGLAVLGVVSGLALRSLVSLCLVPIAYLLGVTTRFVKDSSHVTPAQ